MLVTSLIKIFVYSVNSYNDISAMTDEVLYIGRLPLDIARTPFDPDIISMNGALSYLQVYIHNPGVLTYIQVYIHNPGILAYLQVYIHNPGVLLPTGIHT